VAVALLGAPGLTVLAWPGPAPVADTPTLPAGFAAFSRFTPHAEDRAAGRAIAFFETGSWELADYSYQALVVGADRDSYRQLHGGRPDSLPDRPILLSPDGTQVIHRRVGGGPDEFELLDLRTGDSTIRHGVAWTPREREDVALLAWSPDGRYMAYTVRAPHFGTTTYAGPSRQLVILDLVADDATLLREIEGVYSGAFAPDSRRLALATTAGGLIVSVDGTRLGTWADPTSIVPPDVTYEGDGERSVPLDCPVGIFGLAWSPDGTTLAVATNRFCGHGATLTGGGPAMTVTAFVDTTDGRPRTPQPALPCLKPLGWRSPTMLVGEQIRPDGGYGLAEASLVDGSTSAISHFSYSPSCEILVKCDVWRIQLATNLLGPAGVRDSSYPDRGPWAPIIHFGPVIVVVLVAGAVIWRAATRRRSAPRSRAAEQRAYAAAP